MYIYKIDINIHNEIDTLYKDIQNTHPEFIYSYTVSKTKSDRKYLAMYKTSILQSLYNNISKAYIAWNKYNKTITKNICTKKNKPIPKLKNHHWIDRNVQTHIEKHCVFSNTFSFTVGARTYTIHILLENMTNQSCTRKVKETLKYTYILLHLLQNYAHIHNTGYIDTGKCSKEVDVFLYMTRLKKCLPETTSQPLNQNHVNTAFTTGCQLQTEICVFREEEWLKVLCHESFHNLGLDFISIDTTYLQEANTQVKNIFPVNVVDLRLYETYCEMWGEIINIMLLSYSHSNLNKSIRKTQRKQSVSFTTWCKQLSKYLNREVIFSCIQMNKMLQHNQLTYKELYTNRQKTSKYSEQTQCFAYYVLKGIFMVHYLDFFDFCKHQAESFSVDFVLTKPNLHNYISIILSNYNSSRMLFYISKTETHIKSSMDKSMRMSLHGN